MPADDCTFCKIADGRIPGYTVYEDERLIAFLDVKPWQHGHCLICPKVHVETYLDLPPDLVQPLFMTTQLIARAVEHGLGAEGSFIAINVKVSQTVPHLHVHVVPRRRGDGMKGFFWPRTPYADDAHTLDTKERIRAAIDELRHQS